MRGANNLKMAPRRREEPFHESRNVEREATVELEGANISEDHVCPVCHLLLYRPVTTRCNHTLCEPCMAHWADISVTSQMTIVSLDDEPSMFNPIQVEARCPMCRTLTTASLNASLAEGLRNRHPVQYIERQNEEQAPEATLPEAAMQTLTVYIGNKHRIVTPQGGSSNRHEWTFFVKPSRTDIIEEVHMLLAIIFGHGFSSRRATTLPPAKPSVLLSTAVF